MFRIIFTTLLLFVTTILISQSPDDRAKAYYSEASNAYKNGKYTTAIEYLDKTEEILGKTNARILSLKVKATYANGDYESAKENLDLFSKYSSKATQELKDETYAYIVKVEMAIEKEEAARLAEQQRKEVARLAALKKAEDARIAEEKRIEAERIAKLEKEKDEREAAIAHYEKFHADNPRMKPGLIVPYKKSGSWGFINSSGEAIVPFKYEEAKTAGEGMGAVKDNGKWGFVNEEGKLITPIIYLEVKRFSEGLASFKTNPYWGFINKEGKEVIKPAYSSSGIFKSGLAAVVEYTGESVGFINKKGELIIPFDYQSVGGFYEGLTRVKRKGKWGYINKKNEVVIPIKYEKAANFRYGYAAVKKKSDSKISWGCIDWKGKQLTKWFRLANESEARKRVLYYDENSLSGYYLSSTSDIRNAYLSVKKQNQHLVTIENVEIDNIQQQTILTLRFDLGYKTQSINAPGAKYVLYLQDDKGKRYDLLNQSGWSGDGENGFGFMELNGTPVTVKLYFEQMDINTSSFSFDMLTDNCDPNDLRCWNFYGVRILNK